MVVDVSNPSKMYLSKYLNLPLMMRWSNLHLWKAPHPIFVTLAGKSISFSDVHFLNFYCPITVIPSGMATVFRLLQPLNILLSIALNDEDNFIVSKLVHSKKASPPTKDT